MLAGRRACLWGAKNSGSNGQIRRTAPLAFSSKGRLRKKKMCDVPTDLFWRFLSTLDILDIYFDGVFELLMQKKKRPKTR
jgi:hypothetical protein